MTTVLERVEGVLERLAGVPEIAYAECCEILRAAAPGPDRDAAAQRVAAALPEQEAAWNHPSPSHPAAEGWVLLDVVTTDVAALAIVAPYFAGALSDWWTDVYQRELAEQHRGRLREFESIDLRQQTYKRSLDFGTTPYEASESALMFQTPSNGGYRVFGRFCDLYGEGHLSLCELAIDLHGHGEWEETP